MGEILVLLGELLAQLGKQIAISLGVTAILTTINNLLAGKSGASSYVQISNEIGTTLSEVENGSYGLNALAGLIAAARTDILAAVNALNGGTGGGGTVNLTLLQMEQIAALAAQDVWQFSPTNSGTAEAQTVLLQVANWVNGVANWAGWHFGANPLFLAVSGNFFFPFVPPADVPTPLLANILPTDTLLTWLLREDSAHAWSLGTPTPESAFAPTLSGSPGYWVCTVLSPQFNALKAQIFPPAAVSAAPIWPGLANVTLGTPVAIDTGVTITAPMDGVIISITGVPAKQGQFNFDTAISWRNIGALSFFDDNGEQEFPQTLGFEDCVYCPQTMSVAAGVRLRSSAGVAGTITPWSIV